MRYSYLTPHQFESFRPYIDTLLISTFTPMPIDIAVPHAASGLISQELMERVARRYRGRIASFPVGAMFHLAGLSADILRAVESMQNHSFRYGWIITDRCLTRAISEFPTDTPVQWQAFDWWQWLKDVVPSRRFADALLYLCYSIRVYSESEERNLLGFDNGMAQEMAHEGNRLFEEMEKVFVERILSTWQKSIEWEKV